MANQTITQLPAAGPITGTELVPIVQNGGTYQTTTAAIANSPTLTQTFLTESQELTLNNSRYLSVDTGLQLTDGGATSFLRIGMTGAANSLNSASAGFIVKDGANSVVSRSLTTSGPGISISNADGTGANPIFSLTGSVGSLANFSGLGVLALRPGGTIAGLTVTGTANQISVTDGDGQFGDPVIGLANNPILPGTGSVKVPVGTTAQKPLGSNGEFRYNTDLAAFEGYSSGSWQPFQAGATVSSFSAGTTGLSPSSPTSGAVVLAGTLNVANGGTGATSLTGYVKGSGTSAFTASPTVPYTDVSGLGTIATQNANNVALTGGTISGVGINNSIIGATTPAAGTFTSVAMTTGTISTAPVSGNDIVNKTYADSIASGINFHQSCAYATTTALSSVNYNNGTGGVGATLTATANGALTIDGYTFVSPGDIGKRVLIKDQSAGLQNGVYTVSQVGDGSNPFILTRATDFDTAGPGVDQIDQGDFFLITSGTANANTSWVQQTPLPIIVGTTAIVFTQFGAPLTYSAGTGLSESPAYTFNITNTGVAASTYGSASQVPVFAVNAQGQLTSVTNTPIAIAAGAVSGLAASATTDTTNASNITSGTLGTSRLSGSYTGVTGVGTLGFGTWNANPIGVAYGGTGLTSTPTDGQLPIGNGTGYTLATLTAGTNVFINNTSGGITISATPAAGGTVTSVDVSGGTTGLTTSGGPVTVSGTITLGGTLNVANGGTGATTLTGYVKGNGTSAMTASASIPNTDITGLGTMSTQNAGTVAITGGSIEGTTVGATTAATVRGTTVTATTEFSGPGTGLTGNASGLSIGGNAANVTGTVAVANGGTGATTAPTARTNLGATTVGSNFFTLTNPSAVTFPRINADNTVSALDAATFRSAIGAGTGNGTVTSVSGTGTVNGITLSGTVTSSGNLTLGGSLSGVSLTTQVTGTLPVANGGTGATTLTANNVILGNGTSAVQFVAPGANGNVLTSNGTTWVSQAASSGGGSSFTATASGNLTNGGKVVLNSDGTVSQISATVAAPTAGTSTNYSSTSGGFTTTVYHPPSNSVIYTAYDQVYVGTVSGSAITFSAPVTAPTGGRTIVWGVYDPVSTNILYLYEDFSSYGAAVVGVVSGGTITFGTPNIFNSVQTTFGQYAAVYDPVNRQILMGHSQSSNASVARIATISGNTVTVGSPTTLVAANATPYFAYYPTTKRFIAAVNYQAAVVTVTGTTISAGSFSNLPSFTITKGLVYDNASDKIIFAGTAVLGGGSTYMMTGTVSGTSLSYGSAAVLSANTYIASLATDYNHNSSQSVVTYPLSTNVAFATLSVSGTNVSVASTITAHTGTGTIFSSAYDLKNKQVVTNFRLSAGGYNYVVTNIGVTSNLTSSNFAGISNAAYSGGATATIQVTGAVDDAQSALSIAESYFVAPTGLLTLVNTGTKVGQALTNTNILINNALTGPETKQYLYIA